MAFEGVLRYVLVRYDRAAAPLDMLLCAGRKFQRGEQRDRRIRFHVDGHLELADTHLDLVSAGVDSFAVSKGSQAEGSDVLADEGRAG